MSMSDIADIEIDVDAHLWPLGFSQRLSYTFYQCPALVQQPLKAFPQQLSAQMWQFPSLFSEGLYFC
jgi:hypothetical protein